MQKKVKVYPGEIIHMYDIVPVFDTQTGNYNISVDIRVLDELRKAMELLYVNRAAARNTPKKREARKNEEDRVFTQYRIAQPLLPANLQVAIPKVLTYDGGSNVRVPSPKMIQPPSIPFNTRTIHILPLTRLTVMYLCIFHLPVIVMLVQ